MLCNQGYTVKLHLLVFLISTIKMFNMLSHESALNRERNEGVKLEQHSIDFLHLMSWVGFITNRCSEKKIRVTANSPFTPSNSY